LIGFRGRSSGQALVEFALASTIFLMLLMGILDLGRAIYAFNGVSQASREVSRVASVHTGAPLWGPAEVVAAINVQKELVPGVDVKFDCMSDKGNSTGTTPRGVGGCPPGWFVQVTATVQYSPVTPVLSFLGANWNIKSTSTARVQ